MYFKKFQNFKNSNENSESFIATSQLHLCMRVCTFCGLFGDNIIIPVCIVWFWIVVVNS